MGEAVGSAVGAIVGEKLMISVEEAVGVTVPLGAEERGSHPLRMVRENENNKTNIKIFFIEPPKCFLV